MLSRRTAKSAERKTVLSYTDFQIGLRILLGNATLQVELLANEESSAQLATTIKALLLAADAIEASLPLLRGRRRRLLRVANG
jgi:hypothetical protein